MRILRKFVNYYHPYRGIFWFDMFCALVLSAVDVSFPQILRALTAGLFTQPGGKILRALPLLAALLLGIYLIRFGCQYYITSWGHIMGARMESNMRRDLFDHYQKLSFSYYDRNNTGEMMSKLVSDLFDISELAHHGPENILISLLKIAGSFALMMAISVPMTLVLAAVTAMMFVFSARKNKEMRSIFLDNRRQIAGVNSQVQDSLAGIRVVKSFGNEDLEREKFAKSNLRFLDSRKNSYRLLGNFRAWNTFLEGLLYLTVLVLGGYLVAQKSLSLADLSIYALYINIFVNPIDVLVEFTELFQKGYSGFRRFVEVLDTDPEIQDKPGAKDLGPVQGNIEYRGVSFQYNVKEPVLNHIDLKIRAGEKLALVGPSGGGKTTLCSLLPRFYDVTAGSVTLDGRDVRNVTLRSLRAAIGLVQQDVYMFSGSIRDNIAYGKPGATDGEILQAAKDAGIHEFVSGLPDGYDTYVGERGTRLSGGQKQRIAIARVFLKNPPVLILDEATSALDNESERYIQQSLDRLSRNRTTIVIAHRLSTVRNADEIVVIADGSVAERGPHADLLAKNGIYAKYYNMQFEGLSPD